LHDDSRFRLAAWLLLVQGVIMEVSAAIALPVLAEVDAGPRAMPF